MVANITFKPSVMVQLMFPKTQSLSAIHVITPDLAGNVQKGGSEGRSVIRSV